MMVFGGFFSFSSITPNQLHNLIRISSTSADTDLGKIIVIFSRKFPEIAFHFRHPSFRFSRLILNVVMLSDFS